MGFSIQIILGLRHGFLVSLLVFVILVMMIFGFLEEEKLTNMGMINMVRIANKLLLTENTLG
ncbi:hypothetical protein HMPREF3096_01065 [Klebsiella sp. HMSC25G12]|nr:hypothetical protein HMPREF3096_01065 [Klebsiella sp. HMSC25G12]